MGEKRCGKCGETADEAKAFCPACGHAFVEEKKRTSVTDFDLTKNTVKLSDSMYNKMLTDMGLSISKQGKPDEGRSVVTAPAAATAATESRNPHPEPVKKSSNRTMWIIVGLAMIAVALLVFAVIAAGVFFYFRSS